MAILTRDEILNAEDRQTLEVPVPEWGGSVLVRGLSGTERDQYEESLIRWRGGQGRNVAAVPALANARAKLVSLAVVGEDGGRLFSDRDVVALGEKSAAALERVFDVASKLSGLQAGDVAELMQSFESGPSGDSGLS